MKLSDFEVAKKNVLSLDYDQFVILCFLCLSGWKSSFDSLNDAMEELRGLRRSRTHTLVKKLTGIYLTDIGNGVKVKEHWRVPVFFAFDQLHLKDRAAILAFPPPAERLISRRGNWYYRYHTDLLNEQQTMARLCMMAILNDRPLEFDRHYAELALLPAHPMYNLVDERLIVSRIIGTLDVKFWEQRGEDFTIRCLRYQLQVYPEWPSDGAMRLEPFMRRVLWSETAVHPVIGTLALAAWDTFGNEDWLLKSLPAARVLRAAVDGKAIPDFPADEGREKISLLNVLAATISYAVGNWTAQQFAVALEAVRFAELPGAVSALRWFAVSRVREAPEMEQEISSTLNEITHPLDWLGVLCACAWLGIRPTNAQLEPAWQLLATDGPQLLPWLKNQLRAALNVVAPKASRAQMNLPLAEPNDVKFSTAPTDLGGDAGAMLGKSRQGRDAMVEFTVVDLFPPEPVYKSLLRRLRSVGRPPSTGENGAEPELRTIWIFDFEREVAYPKLQKKGKRGWTKGRKLKFIDFLPHNQLQFTEPTDRNVVAALTDYNHQPLNVNLNYGEDNIYVDFGRLAYELADHPRIFVDEKRRIPVQIERREPELIIEDSGKAIELRFRPTADQPGYVVQQVTPTRYHAFKITPEQVELSTIIQDGIDIPDAEREAVEQLTERFRPIVQVQSSIDLLNEDLEIFRGDPTPTFHLLPYGEAGYRVALFVRPVPESGYYFRPGEGRPRSAVVLDDGRRLLERQLDLEADEAAAAILECPTLARTPHDNYEWLVEDTKTALRILLEIRALVLEKKANIEHPKGEKLRLLGQAQLNDLDLKVAKSRDWFEVDGSVRYDEDRVLSLELLLEALRENKSDFVQLGENEFVAITEELRDKVLEMEGLLHRRGKKLKLPTLAAGAFAEIAQDAADLEYDAAWEDSLQRIEKAASIRPRVPKSFNATLRPYQVEGYKWMMRLAEWGVGGCLADDMGLGKTVQALALLSARADRGPSLVIAPASVTRNWRRETEKFAPDLIPVLIAGAKDVDRINNLGASDLAIVSFGLIPFIGDTLTDENLRWNTIVIDEAQAIKNAATKRAKIVQDLQADFKLATTGTPIENHLGELWSLFRFLNPGLLGSKKGFNEKYNRPIAQHGNEQVREALQRMVKPFILRRRKDQVLKELPAKTEVVLEVELSDEEKVLYEAMRRQALKSIEQAAPEERRFKVLAELTRLRQAACHPRLVRKNTNVPSAKLQLVSETIVELLENGHKALVFSQFVKHLKIVEEWVEAAGIPYQYLDGSTPGKKREQSVQAFQSGEGKLFLISLKAGGTGLNLTAADYVLHLDPWWNPAAEDQASDRAHRIGQRRPVTVYRFVSQDTIEEQIIALHAEKRDLADQILSGTGKAGSLSVEEIVGMLKE